MNPLILVAALAGSFFYFSKSGKKKSDNGGPKALKPSEEDLDILEDIDNAALDKKTASENSGYGSLFVEGDLPNIIESKVGEVFTVRLSSMPSTGYLWRLASTPPRNEVVQLFMDGFEDGESGSPSKVETIRSVGVGGDEVLDYFIFRASKSGSGSIVFHLDPPGAGLPPDQVVEIKIEIREN